MAAMNSAAGTLAYVDCINGAAGDMLVGAMLDAGADEAALRSGIASMGLTGYELTVGRVKKQGLAAIKFDVRVDCEQQQPHRHLKDVVKIIRGGQLSTEVADAAIGVFELLADAEAAVHGTTRDKVHFHEVGAVDAIVDIVGAAICLDSLKVAHVVCSPIPVGSGVIQAAHGILPVPAPATARLLLGIPLAETEETGELTTPTGAAILRRYAGTFGPMPPMTPLAIGYGAGRRDGKYRPNVVRVVLGTRATAGGESPVSGSSSAAGRFQPSAAYPPQLEQIVQLETNLDHVSGELIGHCLERLMEAGALDAFATPIQMKKSRPGIVLTVLAKPQDADALAGLLFAETGTLGIRRRLVTRTTLARSVETVSTPYGPIRVKAALAEGRARMHPEYEDCRSAALRHGVPLREVQSAAEAAWAAQSRSEPP